MPRLTSDQRDALNEAVARQLFRINTVVKGMFGNALSDQELKRAHGNMMGGVSQAMQEQDRAQRDTLLRSGQPIRPGTFIGGNAIGQFAPPVMYPELMVPSVPKIPGQTRPVSEAF